MDKRIVPTLSTDNFISEPILKLDVLYAYFLSSEFSQSNTYKDNISSLKYLMQKNTGDTSGLVSDIISTLTTFLKRYFTEVNVFAELIDTTVIGVSIQVKDSEDIEATLEQALRLNNGRLDTYAEVESLLLK
jgi:O-acetylhomoserine/O-acetylserine sulfhydrylase-like pyridoxal-dependent enzyme